MQEHIHTYTLNDGQGSISKRLVIVADAQIRQTVPIPAGATHYPVDISFPAGRCQSLLLVSDVAMQLDTNDSSAPDDTILLAAGEHLDWNEALPYLCPITADISKLFVTCTAAGNLTIKVLYDPTV